MAENTNLSGQEQASGLMAGNNRGDNVVAGFTFGQQTTDLYSEAYNVG